MIDTSKPFTPENASRAVFNAAMSLDLPVPFIKWSARTTRGSYSTGGFDEITIGPNVWNGWQVLVHEFAHHVKWHVFGATTRGKQRLQWDIHGPAFREALELSADIMLGDVRRYAWAQEYRAIARWASKKGLS